MKVRIKQGEEMIDATIEMVDGVMVVSPKEAKIDIFQFKDGDIITCGHDNPSYNWTCILRGKIEFICNNMFIADYCFYHNDSDYSCKQGDSDSATFVRFATEEEKQKLFDKLAEEGLEWDSTKKELVKIKWKPKCGELMYTAGFTVYGNARFIVFTETFYDEFEQCRRMQELGWCFKTEAKCQAFCDKLNEAINQVKP